MADFKWHLMDEETPEVGKGNYVILGFRDGMYFATRFKESGDESWFVDSRGNHHYTNKVKAWVKIPSLDADE